MSANPFRSFRRQNGSTPNPLRDSLHRVLQVGDLVMWPEHSGKWLHKIVAIAPELRPGAPAGTMRVVIASEQQLHQPPGMVLPLVLIQPAADTEAMLADAQAAQEAEEPAEPAEPAGDPPRIIEP